MQPTLKIYLISDTAFTLSFELPIGEAAHQLVMLAAQVIKGRLGHIYADMVPAYTSLTIYFYDPPTLEANLRPIKKMITELVRAKTSNTNNKEFIDISDAEREVDASAINVVHIPVCYDQSLANDLDQLMDQLQLSLQEIIERHTNLLYKVYMVGFVPGFAYMGTLDPTLYLPRKKTPSRNVPAGSVAIAADQTGIYPFEIPGGWHVIGRTPLTMFNKDREPVCLLQPGQWVRFFSIPLDEFNATQ